jgi:hypothetical protein
MNDSIWQCSAYNITIREAADNFARRYWPSPRKVVEFKMLNTCSATFQVKNGLNTYRISLERSRSEYVYQIERQVAPEFSE